MNKMVHPKMDDEFIETALMHPKVSQPVMFDLRLVGNTKISMCTN